ncbi:MAG: SUMF1/EgtB/PvdO family nonheme iron enzyme [Acidobacteriota bacterium]|nr:SUMF1/EgtB/PvdO family nonheme iron enzyme [Acidobacteriota bacterium]
MGLFGLLGVAIAGVGADEGTDWQQKFYNPQPAEGDLLVPMPCGGAMVFRSIGTEGDGVGALSDKIIELGSDAEDVGYAEYRRLAQVAGGFAADDLDVDGSPDERRMLIGKYEVTALQYQAVMSVAGGDDATCAKESSAGRMPQTKVGWHDAVRFADAWSLWLRAQAESLPDCRKLQVPCLPRVDGEPAFVRLPTEVEWEYAARAGGVERFSWGDRWDVGMANGLGTEGVDHWGAEAPVGRFPPNPWGTYDLFGNASEWVQDVYHPSYSGAPRDGRAWEQEIGPISERKRVVRGGSFADPGSKQRVSDRVNRRPDEVHRGTGFRCATD